jgi:predicted protein tyrosine phosphatase
MQTTLLSDDLRLTVCGLDELGAHGAANVTHVLSILDPGTPEPREFVTWDPHHRLTLRFHDIIGPWPGWEAPEREHVEALLAFGEELDLAGEALRHLLVHCHAGISRSTAALATLLARHTPAPDPAAGLAQLAHGRLRRRDPGARRPAGRGPAGPLPAAGRGAAVVHRRAAPVRARRRGPGPGHGQPAL